MLPPRPGSETVSSGSARAAASGSCSPFGPACPRWGVSVRLRVAGGPGVTLRCGRRGDAKQVPGPAVPRAGQELGSHREHVGCCGHRGAGVGHRLAADSGLGALHQRQV